MTTRRIVTIFGATGQQGSSVVDALLSEGIFVPRAVTRSAGSTAAKALAARGCEVVEADACDKEAVRRAVDGAECVFGVTVPFTSAPELEQGLNMVDASKEAGVKFFVFSSLVSAAEVSNGKYTKCVHYEDKADIEKHLKASGISNAILMTGFFLENLVTIMPLKQTETGYHIEAPAVINKTNLMSWIGKELGSAVAALMRNYTDKLEEINGQNFILGGSRPTLEEVAAEIGKALGKPTTIKQCARLGFPALDEMVNIGYRRGSH